jgi:hypothetical protein
MTTPRIWTPQAQVDSADVVALREVKQNLAALEYTLTYARDKVLQIAVTPPGKIDRPSQFMTSSRIWTSLGPWQRPRPRDHRRTK